MSAEPSRSPKSGRGYGEGGPHGNWKCNPDYGNTEHAVHAAGHEVNAVVKDLTGGNVGMGNWSSTVDRERAEHHEACYQKSDKK